MRRVAKMHFLIKADILLCTVYNCKLVQKMLSHYSALSKRAVSSNKMGAKVFLKSFSSFLSSLPASAQAENLGFERPKALVGRFFVHSFDNHFGQLFGNFLNEMIIKAFVMVP